MAEILQNPWRGKGLTGVPPVFDMLPSVDAEAVAKLLALCPAHQKTALTAAPEIARKAGVSQVLIKDERTRMGLGSFKALGAAYAIARDAADAGADHLESALQGQVYVTASAGNHGMSVAAGAPLFGARAVIYLAETVPEAFAIRLRDKGADVVRAGATYEESMAAAAAAADENGWQLLSDSSWPGYTRLPRNVMEGYLQMAAEAASQAEKPPTHIFLQAGVGGLAAAVAAYARQIWGDGPQIIVVEPDAAPALIESIRAGKVTDTSGPVSSMGRLDCKTPSMVALNGLARDADTFVTITEEDAASAAALLRSCGFSSTTSGVAGLAALLAGIPETNADARVLTFLSEGPEDG